MLVVCRQPSFSLFVWLLCYLHPPPFNPPTTLNLTTAYSRPGPDTWTLDIMIKRSSCLSGTQPVVSAFLFILFFLSPCWPGGPSLCLWLLVWCLCDVCMIESQVLYHCYCFIAAEFPIWILDGVWVTHTAALHTHLWGNIKDFLCMCVCVCWSVSRSVWESLRFQLCCSGERLRDYRYGAVPCSYFILVFSI